MTETKQGIKSWPKSERPRERLIRHGAEVLSDAELVAIILRNGVHGKDAISLGRELVSQFGGLRGLVSVGWQELRSIKGLGKAKVATLMAATEIAKRQLKEQIIGKNVIRDPESVKSYLMSSMRDRKREIFKVLFLNKGNRVIEEQDLFHGTIDESLVHPREIVKAALDYHASAIILVHNHPSGRIQPSREDIRVTKAIISACETVSITVLDHIIVGDNKLYSFTENSLL